MSTEEEIQAIKEKKAKFCVKCHKILPITAFEKTKGKCKCCLVKDRQLKKQHVTDKTKELNRRLSRERWRRKAAKERNPYIDGTIDKCLEYLSMRQDISEG